MQLFQSGIILFFNFYIKGSKLFLFKKNKSLVFLCAFVIGFLFALKLYKSAKIIRYKDNLEYVFKTRSKFINNYLFSSTDSLETIFLDVKYQQWRKLANQRSKIWNYSTALKYYPFQWPDSIDKTEIKGKMTFKNQIYKVDLKLLGLNIDQFGDDKKWSYRISVKGDNVIDRMNKFNLLIPPSRNYVNDFIAQTLLSDLDMISLREKPVKLILNGEDMGIYLQEEFFNKRLIEYNKYRESAILRIDKDFNVNISNKNYLKHKQLVDAFNKKLDLFASDSIQLKELFNFDKMADRLALSVIFGGSHSLYSSNQRYYLNPFTIKLEPLGREFMYSEYINKDFVIKNINVIKNKNSVNTKLFSNNKFIDKFHLSLSKISSEKYLKNIFKLNADNILKMKKAFHYEYPFFDSYEPLIYANSKVIRENFNILTTKIIKDISNDSNYETLILNNINLISKIKNDTIFIDKSIIISNKLHIPKGYKVIIKPGVQILLKEDGQILSESPFYASGSINDSIQFISNTTNKGILFLNAEKSFFNYVKFKGINNYNDKFRTLPGSITFYESPVIIANSNLDTSNGGDDLLNIVRTEFEISNSKISNSFADAFDSDYSNGIIINTSFKNIGNDAIDASTSRIKISNLIITNVNDKGISAGEDSYIHGENIEIYNTSLPLSCKDLSTMTLNEIEINNCDVVFNVFQKKPEYGPARMTCQNVVYNNFKKDYLVQFNNNLNINSKEIKSKIKDVESKLYGKIYGKSSE